MSGSFNEKVSGIKHQHINDALEYIAEKHQDTPNSADIYYILDTHKPASWGVWHGRTKKWFGVKETIRVTYLFTMEKPLPFTEDDIVNELGPRSPREDSARSERWKTDDAEAILKMHGFLCKAKGSGSSEEENE